MLVKTDVNGILKQTENGALLNIDNDSLNAYKKMKNKNLKINEMESDISNLKNDIFEIKNLLTKIVEKL